MSRTPITVCWTDRAWVRWYRVLGGLLLLIGLALHFAPVSRAQGFAGVVYVVQVHDMIDLGLAPYLSRVLDEAERENASAVILEINTPGGRLDAALQIRQVLLGSSVRTIAFVNRDAFSAGALVAIAASEVYMAPGAVIGAATPVTGTGESASEKTISAVRSTFKSTAELRGRDPRLAEAMVDPAVAIDGLVSAGQLLTLTTVDALAWGYADAVVANRQELLQAAGLAGAEVRDTSPALAERVVRFITDPIIASLLISAGVLLLIGDLIAGGSGVPGLAGAALLTIFFWGHMIAGLAGWEGVALVGLGLILLGLEVFVIPGFGVAGILGIVALGAGAFMSLIGGEIVTNEDLVRAGSTVGLALLILVVGGVALLSVLSRGSRGGGLILQAQLGRPDSPPQQEHTNPRPTAPSTAGRPAASDAGRTSADHGSLVGARGVALSDLRPGGIARINGERVDVVTEGDYVLAGTPIEVLTDEGYRRVVHRLDLDERDVAHVHPVDAS